ncbi:hypothetical protein L3Y34_000473 [Caenorhabditis briggsae]|uniref:Uncharacterized protein n=1 Tax=Caenorhabditis briggsae TaxID=6238 RepID=A0AAE9D9B0_CAEBR|nr:hypothetical protein L3Y34_000473 [Caenorhabditis briggsae]
MFSRTDERIVKCHWLVPIDTEIHSIVFKQDMKTGYSDLKVDNKCMYRNARKLSSCEIFTIGQTTLKILYDQRVKNGAYVLEINGIRFREFCDAQNRRFDRWEVREKNETFHVVLDKTKLVLYVNSQKVSSEHKDEGQVTITFQIQMANGTTLSCKMHPGLGQNGAGITHTLFVNNDTIPVPLIVDQNTSDFPATDRYGFLQH